MDFLESSAADLYKSAVRAFPHTRMRQHATHPIMISDVRWVPFVGMKTLFVKGRAVNEGREYTPLVLFKKVNYKGQDVQLVASDGLEYELAKLSLENNDILVRCDCHDFQWRFNYYNHLDKSLYGIKRKKYEGHGGPPANPKEMPGMCKHLMKFLNVLEESGLF